MDRPDWFTAEYRLVKLTTAAVVVNYDDEEIDYILPLSQMDVDVDLQSLSEGDMFQASIPMWLATKKGLV